MENRLVHATARGAQGLHLPLRGPNPTSFRCHRLALNPSPQLSGWTSSERVSNLNGAMFHGGSKSMLNVEGGGESLLDDLGGKKT